MTVSDDVGLGDSVKLGSQSFVHVTTGFGVRVGTMITGMAVGDDVHGAAVVITEEIAIEAFEREVSEDESMTLEVTDVFGENVGTANVMLSDMEELSGSNVCTLETVVPALID